MKIEDINFLDGNLKLIIYNKTTGERYEVNDIDVTEKGTVEFNIFTNDEEEEE